MEVFLVWYTVCLTWYIKCIDINHEGKERLHNVPQTVIGSFNYEYLKDELIC